MDTDRSTFFVLARVLSDVVKFACKSNLPYVGRDVRRLRIYRLAFVANCVSAALATVAVVFRTKHDTSLALQK